MLKNIKDYNLLSMLEHSSPTTFQNNGFYLEKLTSKFDRQLQIEAMVREKIGKKAYRFIESFIEDRFEQTYFLSSGDCFDIYKMQDAHFFQVINLKQINATRRVNKFLEAVNYKLPMGGLYISSVETYANRRHRLMQKYAPGVNKLVYGVDAIFHRVFPKLTLTQRFYFYTTKGKSRMLSRAETFGRLYSCGFEIVEEKEINNVLHFVARKVAEPVFDTKPTYGPLIRLRRVGKDGRVFNVYKLRTMYPYAEYLQDYIYQRNQLDEGGKFKNDFRVSPMGQIFRKFWIDELPMFWNLLKGDMKLIGVRPLSKHYFSLYTPELQEKRTQTKPGLVPPFYADMPKTLEDIMDSELRYLEAYEKNPVVTDVKYFFKIFKNIFFKGARSK